jgi:hypothetical protein
VETQAVILHLHSLDPRFGLRDVVFKHAQYAESQGAICRKYGIGSPAAFVRAFFREILLVLLLFPWLRLLGLALICLYAFAYSRRLYAHEWRDPRILLVPLVNVFLLIVSFVFSVRGLVRGRQTL